MTNPMPDLPPWDAAMPLRKDATDEEILDRINYRFQRDSSWMGAGLLTAREFAAACLAERDAEMAELRDERNAARDALDGCVSLPDANGVRQICLGYHEKEDEYEWLNVVPEERLTAARARLVQAVEGMDGYDFEGDSIVRTSAPFAYKAQYLSRPAVLDLLKQEGL